MKSDAQVQHDVMAQLKWEPQLNAAEIGVSVKNGVVTLSGIVDTYAKKVAAEKAVQKVSGVKAVAEDLQVGLSPIFRKTDAEIAEAVLTALKGHIAIPEENLQVKVEDGQVSLEGEVEWSFQRNAAIDVVCNLAGVRQINNNIKVKPRVTSENIQEKVSAAFHRSATIDARRVSVEVLGSKVILRGKVRSFAERKDAENAVWAAPGVAVVENKLEIEPKEAYVP